MYSLQEFVVGGRRDHRAVSEAKLMLRGLNKGKRRKRICAHSSRYYDCVLVQGSWRHDDLSPGTRPCGET